jgi:hypothetical protein
MSSTLTSAARAAAADTSTGLQELLDLLVTEEKLGVTFVTAALERATSNPSGAFVPVLRNAVTTELHHVEAMGIGYGVKGSVAGRFYEEPADPIAYGVGTPASHIIPQ